METGRSSSVYSAYSSVRSMPRTSPSDDTISVTTSPQPPWRLTRRRNAVSVMPAMGATTSGDTRFTFPIFTSVGFHIGGVDFHADRLADQIDRQDQPRLVVLARQPAHHTLERAVRHLHQHALADQGARVVGQIALEQLPDGVDLVLGDGRRLAVDRDDVHHSA